MNEFFGRPDAAQQDAAFLVLPIAGEATVSYGTGTAAGPAAILDASQQIELWDDETETDLETIRCHTTPVLTSGAGESFPDFLQRIRRQAERLHSGTGLVIGIGGEHSITPPLVFAAAGDTELSGVTIVQFDAHADLREEYEGSPYSHACAMRRLVDAGASLIGIGIRSISREEHEFATANDRIQLFRAQDLNTNSTSTERLTHLLASLTGRIYVTVDVDGLDCALCPATGTPEPGGLPWWTFLDFLKRVIVARADRQLIGCDVVETVPMPGSQVNEFTAARIVGKMIAYTLAAESTTDHHG